MTVREIYEMLSERIPESLREEWDNDGIMCCPDDMKEVCRVLISLDVTEEIVDYATGGGFDLIISHHPLIFKPIRSLDINDNVARKLIKLSAAGVSVISLHTRADKVKGGVNDCLARLIGLSDIEPLGDDGLGRVGRLECETGFEEFAGRLKSVLGIEYMTVSEAYLPVYTVAVVGGEGKSYIKEAVEAGADTFVSGSIGYNAMEDAPEIEMNLIEAGHYATEFPITGFFSHLLNKIDPSLYIEIVGSNMSRLI